MSAAGAIDARNRGKRDARIANQRFGQGVRSYDAGISAFESALQRGDPLIARMLETAQQGLTEQRAIISDVGDYGFMQIADALSGGRGALQSRFGGRGMSGSTAMAGAQRALGRDIGRGYADLTSQLAGVRSQTVRAALNDLMSAQGQAAGYHANAGSTLASLHSQKASGILSVGHQPAQGVAAGWGAAGAFLGRALDDWMGGGSGVSVPPPTVPMDVGVEPGQMGPGLENTWGS
jgi:hypothetical protein